MGTFNYNLATFLGELVKKVAPMDYSCSDTFLIDLGNYNIENKFTVSFDVYSLFTNIPLNNTLDLAVKIIFEKSGDLKITRKEFKALFVFSTSKTNFIFQGVIYNQIDGIAMGSPLAHTLVNLFMGFNEEKWLKEFKGASMIYLRFLKTEIVIFALLKHQASQHQIYKGRKIKLVSSIFGHFYF